MDDTYEFVFICDNVIVEARGTIDKATESACGWWSVSVGSVYGCR